MACWTSFFPRRQKGYLVTALLIVTMLSTFIYTQFQQRCTENGIDQDDIAVKEYLSKGKGARKDSKYVRPPLQHYQNVTVVTAFFSLGKFIKGTVLRQEDFYQNNAEKISLVQNHLLFYTNSKELAQQVVSVRRSRKPPLKTDIVMFDVKTSWAFSLRHEIERIFNQKGYPKYHPQTTNANYSMAMHAKYEVMADAINSGRVSTTHICWMDFGIWRNEKAVTFAVGLPNDLYENHVAYTEIEANSRAIPRDIVYLDMVWVVGAFFLGRVGSVRILCQDYQRAVEWMVNHSLMSTDQQVIYILYCQRTNLTPRVQIQTYKAPESFLQSPWYYLAYRCREE